MARDSNIPQRFDDKGRPLCGARKHRCRACNYSYDPGTERDVWHCPECGEPRWCIKLVEAEGKRCYHHGKTSPKGIAHPNYKHGGFSKYMPPRLQDRYEEFFDNEDLASLRKELAILDSRLAELLDNMDTAAPSELFMQIYTTWKQVEAAIESSDPADFQKAIREHRESVQAGRRDGAAWKEVFEVINLRGRTVDRESKRLRREQQFVKVSEAVMFARAVMESVKDRVTDPDVRRDIVNDVSAIMNRGE